LKLINGIVAVALLVVLLQNRQPILAAAALVLVLGWSLCLRLSKGQGFQKLEWAIVICLAYWLLNYTWSVGDFQTLISYNFLRRDGALLVSYTAFLGFLGWSLKPGECRNFWIICILLLALIAVPGLVYCLHLFPYPYYIEELGVVSFDPNVGGRMFLGWYEAHNSAGGVYALGSVLALAIIHETRLSPKFKQFLWFLLCCCLGGLVFSYSRGGYLGFLLGIAFILPLRKVGKTLRVTILISIPLILISVMTSTFLSRIDTITDPYYGTNADRFRLWGEAFDDIAASPFIGIGFSRFNDRMVDFHGIKGLYWVGVGGEIINDDSNAHNSYLHFLAEGGIVGLLLTLRIWWLAWAELSFFQSRLIRSKLRGLHKAAKACLVALLMLSFTEHMLGKGSVVMVLMSLVGMTLATSRLEWRAAKEATAKARGPLETGPRTARKRQLATFTY